MWYNSDLHIATKENRRGEVGTNRIPTPHKHMTADLDLKNELGLDRSFLSIADFTATIHSFSDEQKLLDFTIESLLSITEASAGSIFIWDDVAKELVPKAIRGPYFDRIEPARVKLREGVAGWVAERGSSILVKNVLEDNRFLEIKRSGKYQSLSFIAIPLLSGNKLVGVVNITEKKDLSIFNEDDFDRVNAVAKHLAIAYENIRTEKRLWHENEELADSVSEMKEQLQQQEPLVSIGKLSANLAHELNNPLDGIRRFINLSLDQMTEESLAREYLLKAKTGVRRAVQVVKGLLSFSSLAAKSKGKTAELHHLIEDSLTISQQNPSFQNVGFEYKFAEGLVHFQDTGLITVFQNLFENARHAMNDHGHIFVNTEKKEDRVIISVRDTGNGIPENSKNRVFEPFYTTKEHGKGTGIGLSICRDIVERAGGELTFTSIQGVGTTFFVKIPYIETLEQQK